MKKIIILLLYVLLLKNAAQAQAYFGLKGGLNLSNWSTSSSSSDASYSFSPSYHFGAVIQTFLSKAISLQTEVVYSMQGSKIKSATLPEPATVNVAYLNVPLLIKLNTNAGFFAEFGPQIGFLLSAKLKYGSYNENVKDGISNTDFDAVVGLGFVSQGGFGLTARYNFGFKNLSNDGSGKFSNQIIQGGLVVIFGNGKRN